MTALLVAALAASIAQGQPALDASISPQGLASLTYGGESFLQDGAFQVWGVAFRTWDGERRQGDLSQEQGRLDGQVLVRTHPWGEVRCTYTPEADRLRLGIEVENRSPDILSELALSPLRVRFPQPPRGWVEHMPYRGFNLGWPTANVAQCEKATVAICNEDTGRPLQTGWAGQQSVTERPVVVSTVSDWAPELTNPKLYRPIYPGGTDRFEITVRFGPAMDDPYPLVADLYERFAREHPFRLKWEDRRPIGGLFLSSSGIDAPGNPRGWFGDREADFLSEQGRAAFRERLLQWGRQSVEVIRNTGGQGMIVWDVEGQEYPHAISYLGDPRSLPPEMEPLADEFFRLFRDAGLRTGICIRPQIPVRAAYGDWVDQVEVADPAANLDAKIAYAKERWGCTLFYVDSNGDPNVPVPASVFQEVAARHPDVLLIPEHENAAYYTCGAPYHCYANLQELGTADLIRRMYPEAFCVVYIGHRSPAPAQEQLVEAVRKGDILIFHGWYENPETHPAIRAIYEAAK